jgi:uncharacterized protein (DUF433 family)
MLQDHIVLDPAILAGKAVIRGTRLSVESDGWNEADILANYPSLSREDIAACLSYAMLHSKTSTT